MSFRIKFLLMNVDILFSDTTRAMVVNLAVDPPFEHNTGELDTSVIKLEQIYRAGVAWCDGQSQLPQNGARQDSKSLAVVVLPEPDWQPNIDPAVTPACRLMAARLASPAGRVSVTGKTLPVRRAVGVLPKSCSILDKLDFPAGRRSGA